VHNTTEHYSIGFLHSYWLHFLPGVCIFQVQNLALKKSQPKTSAKQLTFLALFELNFILLNYHSNMQQKIILGY